MSMDQPTITVDWVVDARIVYRAEVDSEEWHRAVEQGGEDEFLAGIEDRDAERDYAVSERHASINGQVVL